MKTGCVLFGAELLNSVKKSSVFLYSVNLRSNTIDFYMHCGAQLNADVIFLLLLRIKGEKKMFGKIVT